MKEILEIFKAMEPSKERIKRLQEGVVKKPYDVSVLEGIYTQKGIARAFNDMQLLTMKTDEPKHFMDYEGNVIEREFDCEEMFKFIDELGFEPDIKVTVKNWDFIEVLREADARKLLTFYMSCNDELDKLIFYTILGGEKNIIAERELRGLPISEKFDDVLIHNYRNLYEIFIQHGGRVVSIYVDSQRNLIKFYNGKVELLMGCNSKNFDLV